MSYRDGRKENKSARREYEKDVRRRSRSRDRSRDRGDRDNRQRGGREDEQQSRRYDKDDRKDLSSRENIKKKEPKFEQSSRIIWGNIGKEEEEAQKKQEAVKEIVKVKADFGLSGALAKDETTGNIQNGVVLKWSEPLDSANPTRNWRLYVFKGDSIIENLHINQKSSYCFGRDKRAVDILILHPASSKQHAVIQFRKTKRDGEPATVKPYIIDLQSANKTFLNGSPIEDSRYYELREKDSLRFGLSEREYVLMVAD